MSSVNRNRSSSADSASVRIRSLTSGIAWASTVGLDAETRLGQEVHAPCGQLVVIQLLDVVRVHPGQLLGVERGRVARHPRQVEGLDQLARDP